MQVKCSVVSVDVGKHFCNRSQTQTEIQPRSLKENNSPASGPFKIIGGRKSGNMREAF